MLPAFTAETAVGPSRQQFRHRSLSIDASHGPLVAPQSSWQNCSDDGLLCYYCSDDAGPCICNWFYNGVWQATTDCGSGF
jgi:hypothetical protein